MALLVTLVAGCATGSSGPTTRLLVNETRVSVTLSDRIMPLNVVAGFMAATSLQSRYSSEQLKIICKDLPPVYDRYCKYP